MECKENIICKKQNIILKKNKEENTFSLNFKITNNNNKLLMTFPNFGAPHHDVAFSTICTKMLIASMK